MTVIVAVLHLLFIAFISWQAYKRVPEIPFKQFFFPGLLLKLFMGLVYGLIYLYHYEFGDTLNYFSDALLLADMAASSPLDYFQALLTNCFPDNIQASLMFINQPRALFFVKVASLFVFLSMGNYWICSLYFSLISFLGLFYLAKTCAEKWPLQYRQAAIAFLLFPSVLFWSSGLSKESLVMGCLGFLVGIFLKAYFRKQKLSLSSVLTVLLSIYIVWILKYYYAAVLIPILVALLLVTYGCTYVKINRNSFAAIGSYFLLFSLLLWIASQMHPVLSFSHFMQNLVKQHDVIVEISQQESLIRFTSLCPNLYSFVSYLPLALFSGLFRPGLWDAANFFQWLVALENLMLLIFTVVALWQIRKNNQVQEKLLLLGTLMYILALAALLTFAAPNFGALARYKIGFFPFFIFIVIFNNPLLDKLLPIASCPHSKET